MSWYRGCEGEKTIEGRHCEDDGYTRGNLVWVHEKKVCLSIGGWGEVSTIVFRSKRLRVLCLGFLLSLRFIGISFSPLLFYIPPLFLSHPFLINLVLLAWLG